MMRRSVVAFIASAAAHAAVLAWAASFIPGREQPAEPAISVDYVTLPSPPKAPDAPLPTPAESLPVKSPAPPEIIPPRPVQVPRPQRPMAIAPTSPAPQVEAKADVPPADIAPPAVPGEVIAAIPAPSVSASPAGASRAPTNAVAALGAARSPVAYASNPKPVYPGIARQRGQEGRVMLHVVVRENGEPGEITILQSSGYALLDRAARDGVARWRFAAATVDGQPASGAIDVPVTFRLDE